mgnify:CR=1 FL=1
MAATRSGVGSRLTWIVHGPSWALPLSLRYLAILRDGAYAKGWRIFAKDDNGHFWYRIGTYRFTNKTEALLFDRGPEALALPSDASGGAPPKRAAEASERRDRRERRSGWRAALPHGRRRQTHYGEECKVSSGGYCSSR